MRIRLLLPCAVLAAVAAACHGGGGGGSTPPPLRALYVNADVPGQNAIAGYAIDAAGAVTPIAGSPWTQSVTGVGYYSYGSTLAVDLPHKRVFSLALQRLYESTIGADGVLTTSHLLDFPPGDHTVGITPSADGSLLFLATYDVGSVPVVRVGNGGSLAQIPGSPFPAFPVSGLGDTALTVDGTRLYGLNGIQSLVEGYAIGSSGFLTALPSAPYHNSAGRSDNFERAPGADRFYVAALTSGFITQFDMQPSGQLVENAARRIVLPVATMVAFDDGGQRLYAVNKTNQLFEYDVAGDGTLSPGAGSPFTLAGVSQGWIVRAGHDGSMLFVKDVTAAEFHLYTIAADGTPTEVAGSPFALPAGALGSGVEFTF